MFRLRSCASSTITVSSRRSRRSWAISASSSPSVITRSSVCALERSLKRTAYPTAPPNGTLSSCAIRSAIVRAASRRGCVCAIAPRTPRPSSRQILGSCVDFPEPVAPATTTTWLSRIAASSSSRRALIGSSSGYSIEGGTAAWRRSLRFRARSYAVASNFRPFRRCSSSSVSSSQAGALVTPPSL